MSDPSLVISAWSSCAGKGEPAGPILGEGTCPTLARGDCVAMVGVDVDEAAWRLAKTASAPKVLVSN
jgi:hypothetical protein